MVDIDITDYFQYPFWPNSLGKYAPRLVLFSDVDGSITDNITHFDGNRQIRGFNMSDGHAVELLKQHRIMTFFLSGEDDISIIQRMKKLNVPFVHTGNKLQTVINLLKGTGYGFAAFGNDIMDVSLLGSALYAGCPNDAHFSAKDAVVEHEFGFVSRFNGGFGAFREFADWLIGEVG